MRANNYFFYMMAISILIQSCIFVIHDKEKKVSLTSTDSSGAYGFKKDSIKVISRKDSKDSITAIIIPNQHIDTKKVTPQEVVQFAETLIGTPYKYGSTNPSVGFDCSGFITYTFNHFGIVVPRSSIDFIAVGKDVPVESSKTGDLILFTGTDSSERFVGHIGLIVSNVNGLVNFIHSTSGKKYGVTITPLNDYYRGRYMKTVRIFP